MKVAAIIVAGGTGSRMKTDRPKQFIDLAGKPLLAHTLSCFERCSIIDRVTLVLPRRGFDDYRRLMSRWVSDVKPVDMVPGGEERQDSIAAGLDRPSSGFPKGWLRFMMVHALSSSPSSSRRVVEAAERTGGCARRSSGLRDLEGGRAGGE